MALLTPILPHTDFFMPNDEEAHALTGEGKPRDQAERFLDEGCKTVVITQGRHGTLLMNDSTVYQAGVFPIDFVDGSGSGDAFAAGFIAGLVEKRETADILRFASAIGASACTKLGCTTGVFTRPEADAFLRDHPLTITQNPR
jgi:sugar/nucleoside kinase (ribokinase family)